MNVFINAMGASAGGGLTYLWNVLPHFAEHPEITVFLLADQSGEISSSKNLNILQSPSMRGQFRRFFWEQTHIPKLLRDTHSDVLISTGNFAVWRSPVPQILLSRNSLYISHDFRKDLWNRGDYRLLADTVLKGVLARRSIQRTDVTIAPSHTFARELEAWTGRRVTSLHHGFDGELFFPEKMLAPDIQQKLREADGSVKLLFVSHYNYYRNFETLLKALPLLKQKMPSRKFRLFLTCELSDGANPGSYRTNRARQLLQQLKIEEDVVELGTIPYAQLHHLYRACDIYLTAAYTETFAHPLVEAMASGLPIVASDIAVHREITAEGALFFQKFSPPDLTDKVSELLASTSLAGQLRQKGLRRAQEFSWKNHVAQLLQMAAELVPDQFPRGALEAVT